MNTVNQELLAALKDLLKLSLKHIEWLDEEFSLEEESKFPPEVSAATNIIARYESSTALDALAEESQRLGMYRQSKPESTT